MPNGEPFDVQLTHQEALVLYDWLASLDDNLETARRDEAQQYVLWRLEGKLESKLVDIVLPDYFERVAFAKQGVIGD